MDELFEILNIKSPSGHEDEMKSYIYYQLLDYVDEINTDNFGNLIARKNGRTDNKVMLTTGIDCQGFMVTVADNDKGMNRFEPLYDCSPERILNKKVTFISGTVGVVSSDTQDNPKIKNLYVDTFGEKVSTGDIFTLNDQIIVSGDYISFDSLSACIGIYALINIAKSVQEPNNTVYYAFCTQSELKYRGAKTAAYAVSPDFAICIDTAKAGRDTGVKLGKGPAVRVMDKSLLVHPYVKNLIIDSASRLNIPYQLEVGNSSTSEGGVIQITGGGIPTGAISVPLNYKGTESEVCLLSDAEKLIEIFVKGDIL